MGWRVGWVRPALERRIQPQGCIASYRSGRVNCVSHHGSDPSRVASAEPVRLPARCPLFGVAGLNRRLLCTGGVVWEGQKWGAVISGSGHDAISTSRPSPQSSSRRSARKPNGREGWKHGRDGWTRSWMDGMCQPCTAQVSLDAGDLCVEAPWAWWRPSHGGERLVWGDGDRGAPPEPRLRHPWARQ